MLNKKAARVLSGMRPTGGLHLGHLCGVLDNWKKLQDQEECFYFVADWHALTTDYGDGKDLSALSKEMVLTWLVAGIDAQKSTVFVQSQVPHHAELFVLLSMICPLPWLTRLPTYKEQKENLRRDLDTHGFLGYPLLQSADILIYQAGVVPVGEDQLAHVEFTREVARRFNHFYGDDILREPQSLLTAAPRVPGTDGRKMSKSCNNTVDLFDSPQTIKNKIAKMQTDPARMRRSDKGNPDNCPVWTLHQIFSSDETKAWAAHGCKTAAIGCLDCKGKLSAHINDALDGFIDRRRELEKENIIGDILSDGAKRARRVANETLQATRRAMNLIGDQRLKQ